MTASSTSELTRPGPVRVNPARVREPVLPGPGVKSSDRVDAGDISWHVQRTGNGTPTLLLHGTGSSLHSWSGLLPLLSRDHELLVPDLPGLGQTSGPGVDFSLPGMARAVGELLHKTGFQPQIAVGHSAGAAIILRMVLDGLLEPRLVVGINAALLPFGGPLARALHPLARVFSRLPMLHALAAARARRPGAVERLIAGTGSRLSEEGIAAYRRLLGSEEHVVATLAMMARWDLDGLLADLPRLSAPLCLLVGSRDFAVPPSQAERIRERLRDPLSAVHIRRLPGLGHLAHEERPDLVAEAIRACEMREENS